MSFWHMTRLDRLEKKSSLFALPALSMLVPCSAFPDEFDFRADSSVLRAPRALAASHFRERSGIAINIRNLT
ncbi:hypothetical protein, partial [Novosphingobium sp.]|uniref:hypothetical protein n=1 Tax=Novosphingobium sp. TaxID=1874826 RepID=UPI002B48BE04